MSERSGDFSEKQRRLKVEVDDTRNVERRACLKTERRIASHELHSSLKNDENSLWNKKARELDEAGRMGEHHGTFAAVKFMKSTSVRQFRGIVGIRLEEREVVTH